jgi:7-cyano-7-deazaguanine synthase
MNKPLAVVLMSGGMDSTVCAAMALADGCAVAALHVRYGQRTQERELQSFNAVCDHYDISARLVVDVSHLAAIGGSSLTDAGIPVSEAQLHSAEVPTSYVPFRNANILAVATSWAEVLQAHRLYIGAVEDDSSGYPDCRQEFFDAFQNVIRTGTKPNNPLRVYTPLIHMTKEHIVRTGIALSVPFELTWSCYRSTERACGTCDSCALRLRGFEKAQSVDPLEYIERPHYS